MRAKFDVYRDGQSWCARGIGEAIFTFGDSFEELIENVKEAVEVHFDDEERPIGVLLLTTLEVPRAAVTAG